MKCFQAHAALPAALLITLLSGCSSSQSPKSGTDVKLECTPADMPQSSSGYGLQPFFANPKIPARATSGSGGDRQARGRFLGATASTRRPTCIRSSSAP